MRRAHGSSTCTRYCASTGLESSWCYSWPAACGGGFFAKARFGTHTLSRHSKYHVRPGDLVRLVISETRGQASASGSTSYMPYTRRRPLSLSRYGRARGRGRHLLVRVDAAGPPRPRSYKILQPVDGRRRTGGWWKRRISGWCPAGWSRGGWVCGCCAWCASCPLPETGRPRGPRSPGRVTAQRGGAYGRGVSSMRLGNSHGRGRARAQPGLHVEPLVLQRVFGQHALPRVELHQFRQHVLRLGGDIRVVWVAKLPCDDRLLRRHVGISDERVEAKQRDIERNLLQVLR